MLQDLMRQSTAGASRRATTVAHINLALTCCCLFSAQIFLFLLEKMMRKTEETEERKEGEEKGG